MYYSYCETTEICQQVILLYCFYQGSYPFNISSSVRPSRQFRNYLVGMLYVKCCYFIK